jgi:hypothetical protein
LEADKVKWFVIVNPVAGGGRGLDHFPQISKLLRDAHIVCEPVFTEHKFHATELTVSAVKEGYRNIIVVGGDGTLHEVVNGLFIQQEVCPDEVLLAVAIIMGIWVRMSALILSLGILLMFAWGGFGAGELEFVWLGVYVFLIISGGGLYAFDTALTPAKPKK